MTHLSLFFSSDGYISAKVCNYKYVAGINNPSNASNNTVELYRKYGKSPISDIEKLIYGFNAPQSKLKTEPIQTKICECCRLKRPLSAFLTINSKICRSCSLNNQKTKTKLDLRRICECCCTEQPLSAFSDNLGFSSFKTCQRCRDAIPAHNKRNRPRRLC
jgi:hypothetical protein